LCVCVCVCVFVKGLQYASPICSWLQVLQPPSQFRVPSSCNWHSHCRGFKEVWDTTSSSTQEVQLALKIYRREVHWLRQHTGHPLHAALARAAQLTHRLHYLLDIIRSHQDLTRRSEEAAATKIAREKPRKLLWVSRLVCLGLVLSLGWQLRLVWG